MRHEPSRAGLATALVVLCVSTSACSKSNTVDDDGGGIMFDATLPDASTRDAGPDPDVDAGPPGSTGPDDIGEPCSSGADCEGGFCIGEDDGFRDGYCTAACRTNDDCGGDAQCIPVGRGMSVCLDGCDPDAEPRACREGYGCATGFMIPAPVCLPGCTDDGDCAGGAVCDRTGGMGAGRCYDPDAELGDECESEDECGPGTFCLGEDFSGWPGGACVGTDDCDPDRDTGCPGDAHCFRTGMGGSVCIDGCERDRDCREGYTCRGTGELPERTSCLPGCEDDSVCSGGRVCAPGTGICDVPFDADDLGEPCSTSMGACAGGTCLREFESGFPGSVCVYLGCDPAAPDADDGCPGDGVCILGGDGETTICVDGCADEGDCRDGYTCRAAFEESSGGTACFPGCESDRDCANDRFECNPGTGLCRPAFDDGDFGDPCAGPDACAGGVCVSEAAEGWPGGACLFPGCRLSGEGPAAECPMGGVCVDDETGDPTIGACAVACEGAGDCRSGYRCDAETGACTPACAAASDCSAGRACDTDTGLCG